MADRPDCCIWARHCSSTPLLNDNNNNNDNNLNSNDYNNNIVTMIISRRTRRRMIIWKQTITIATIPTLSSSWWARYVQWLTVLSAASEPGTAAAHQLQYSKQQEKSKKEGSEWVSEWGSECALQGKPGCCAAIIKHSFHTDPGKACWLGCWSSLYCRCLDKHRLNLLVRAAQLLCCH